MPRLDGGRDGWGAVDHPETGELIQLNEEHPKDVAETVADAYEWLEVVEDSTADEEIDEPPDTESEADTTTVEATCGYEGCSRTVSDPEDTCWQHPNE